MTVAVTEKKSKLKVIIIVLVVLVLVAASAIGYFMVTGKQVSDIVNMFQSNEEYTILLDEFVANLYSENGKKSYLKVKIALMYTDKKHEKSINSNVNKIRDLILNDIREKTSQDMLEKEHILKFKKEIINNINSALKDDIVKDVYFTDLIIQ